MSPDGHRRSREHWTDTMEAGPPDPPAHVHRLPAFVRLAMFLLVVAQVLTLAGLGITMVANYRQQQYIEGRGEFRDREAARMEAESQEQIRQAMCDLLDQFPEGGWLDRPRAKYECGPGIPIADLSPEEQEQLAGRARPQIKPIQPTGPATDLPPGAMANPPRQPSTEPPAPSTPQPAEPTPEPAPESGPLVGLEPVTEPVCGLLRVCG